MRRIFCKLARCAPNARLSVAVSGFGQRLSAAIDAAGLTQSQVAERVGASAELLSRWKRRAEAPRSELIGKVAETLGVRAGWLATGEGPRDLDALMEAVREGKPSGGPLLYRDAPATRAEVEAIRSRLDRLEAWAKEQDTTAAGALQEADDLTTDD